VKTLEAMIGELDMRLDTESDAAELRHETLESRFKFNEELLKGVLRGTTQLVVVMHKLVGRDHPKLLEQALADAKTSFKKMMEKSEIRKQEQGLTPS
jgi:hypothetical protein